MGTAFEVWLHHTAGLPIPAALADLLPELKHDPGHHRLRLEAARDSAGGIPGHAPYAGIIATCAVPTIPAIWIDQLAPGGRIVTDLRGELASSLTVLGKIAPGTVECRLLDLPGHFMWLRSTADNPLPNAGHVNLVINLDDAETTATDPDPRMLHEPGCASCSAYRTQPGAHHAFPARDLVAAR